MKARSFAILACIILFFFIGTAAIKGSSGHMSVSTLHDVVNPLGKTNTDVRNIKIKEVQKPDYHVYHGATEAEIAEVTKNIEYGFAKSSIRPIYYNNLDRLAKLVANANYVVSLRGHSDSIGSYKPNWVLSDKRATNVKDYLITKGVNKDHIVTIPFGSTIPIASNETALGRQKNRRVEIKLKEIK